MKEVKAEVLQEYMGEAVFTNSMSVNGYSASFAPNSNPEPFNTMESLEKQEDKKVTTIQEDC